MPNNEVDTEVLEPATTEQTEIETPPATEGADTEDTAKVSKVATDYIRNVFGTASEESEIETTEEETVDTEVEEAEDETIDEEETVTEEEPKVTEPAKVVFELEDNGKVEAIDVSTEEGRAKAEKYMKAGRYVERVRHEQKEKEANLTQLAQTIAYQTLYLQNQGKLSTEDFIKKPFEDFVGAGENDLEDRKLWNEDNQRVERNLAQLNEYAQNHDRTAKQFNALVEKFSANHPDVTDVQKWIEENVMPYHEPIFTYGSKPYPDDTLEMIYFAKNRDKVIKEAVDKALKEYVEKPVVKKKIPPQVKSQKTAGTLEEIVRKNIQTAFNPEGRELAG